MQYIISILCLVPLLSGIANAQAGLKDKDLNIQCTALQEELPSVQCDIRERKLSVIDIFRIDNPNRIVVDLGRRPRGGSKKIATNSIPSLEMIRTGWHPDKYRIVFDIDSASTTYSWTQQGDTIRLAFSAGVPKPAVLEARKIDPIISESEMQASIANSVLLEEEYTIPANETEAVEDRGLEGSSETESENNSYEAMNEVQLQDAPEAEPFEQTQIALVEEPAEVEAKIEPAPSILEEAPLPAESEQPQSLVGENPFGEEVALIVPEERTEEAHKIELETETPNSKKVETLVLPYQPERITVREPSQVASIPLEHSATEELITVPVSELRMAPSPPKEPAPTQLALVPASPEVQASEDELPELENNTNARARLNPAMIPSTEEAPALPEGQYLRSISFAEPEESDAAEALASINLLLTEKPRFNLSRTGPKTYRLRILDGKMAQENLELPFFPPHTFPGVSFVQAQSEAQRIDVTIGVERGTQLMAATKQDTIELKVVR